MKILVLGATGMAGHIISIYLKEKGYDVTTFSRKKFSYCKNVIGDAMNKNEIFKLLDNDYDVVINCIGVLNKSCDEDISKAIYLNSYLPHSIVKTLKNKKTKYIHMSTDCVFSGKNGNYDEMAFKDGDSIYDRTKALGEVVDNKNLTFRNSIIGPDMNANGIGLFNWFMKQNETIGGYTKAIWTGVTTLTLAKAMEQAIKEDLTGLYNLVNNNEINKYDLLNVFNNEFNRNLNIKRDASVDLNKALINTRKDFSFEIPSYEKMIEEMKVWIYNHKELYPHYFKQKEEVL